MVTEGLREGGGSTRGRDEDNRFGSTGFRVLGIRFRDLLL